jgi:hypothetical protein
MGAPLITCAKEQQYTVIRFLLTEGLRVAEIHQRLSEQHGDSVLLQ